MAATTLFRIGAGATCTDGVCGRVTRSARGLAAVDAAGTRPRAWPRLPLVFDRGTVTLHG